jgi:hypothetical protein
MHTEFSLEKLKGKDQLGELNIYGKIILELKWALLEEGLKGWTRLNCCKVRFQWWSFVNTVITVRFHRSMTSLNS